MQSRELFVTKVQEMVKYASENDLLLLVCETKYAIAGIPDGVTSEYISFPAKSIEVGSTGSLGRKEGPEEYEINPWPKIIRMDAVRFVEFVSPPAPPGHRSRGHKFGAPNQ
jgi:hypothetical protein